LASIGSVSTYIHHHTAVAEKFAPGRFHVDWLTNIKRHIWGRPSCVTIKSIVKHS